MKVMYRAGGLIWIVGMMLMSASLSYGEVAGMIGPLNLPANKDTIIRFFYQPAGNDFRPALLFRVAGEKDPRLNMAPIAPQGRTGYLSLREMEQLMQKLAAANLSWQASKQTEVPGTFNDFFKKPPSPGALVIRDQMEIKIFSSTGAATALISPDKICTTLEPYDSVFRQPRPLWEFQFFRRTYHCNVPGFNRNAFPQHDSGEAKR